MPTIMTTGHGIVFQEPSELILLGLLEADDATLELAINALDQRKKALAQWLSDLHAEEVLFGDVRFSDQTEADPLASSQKLVSKQLAMATGQKLPEENAKRTVVVSYTASWPLEQLNSLETLVLVDRIRFEAENLVCGPDSSEQQDSATSPSRWPSTPEDISAMVSAMAVPPSEPKTLVFFSTRLSESNRQAALRDAIQQAQKRAQDIADAANGTLGPVVSIHSTGSETNFNLASKRFQRMQQNPLWQEVPQRSESDQVFCESPRQVEFQCSVHVTYELLNAATT